jgi:hypothetical protein
MKQSHQGGTPPTQLVSASGRACHRRIGKRTGRGSSGSRYCGLTVFALVVGFIFMATPASTEPCVGCHESVPATTSAAAIATASIDRASSYTVSATIDSVGHPTATKSAAARTFFHTQTAATATPATPATFVSPGVLTEVSEPATGSVTASV